MSCSEAIGNTFSTCPVGIATGYGLRGRNSSPDRVKNFLFLVIKTVSGAHPPFYSIGIETLSPAVKLFGPVAYN
jgi:hypothetical protein